MCSVLYRASDLVSNLPNIVLLSLVLEDLNAVLLHKKEISYKTFKVWTAQHHRGQRVSTWRRDGELELAWWNAV